MMDLLEKDQRIQSNLQNLKHSHSAVDNQKLSLYMQHQREKAQFDKKIMRLSHNLEHSISKAIEE